MRSMGLWLAAALTVWSAGFGRAQTTHYVVPPGTPGGKDTPPFNAWTSAATNIQAALNAAVSGDVVLVTNAWYPLATELIVTQSVTLASWNDGAPDPAGTSLDGQGARRCVYLNRALVSGFTLSNGTGVGTASSNVGGAVYMAGGTLSNCVVAGSSADANGGGVYVASAAGLVANCRVEGNSQTNTSSGTTFTYGGGGLMLASGATLRSCTVARNTSETRRAYCGGGGVFATAAPILIGCRVESNQSYNMGGGVHIRTYNGQTIRECTLAGNTVVGTYGGGGLGLWRPAIGSMVSDCRIADNSASSGGGGISAFLDTGNFGLILSNCTVDGNTASSGGGYAQVSSATPTNNVHDFRCYHCSFSSNRVSFGNSAYGGGIRGAWSGMYLESCTIRANTAHNRAGAFFSNYTTNKPFAMRNCLVADNVATGTFAGVGGVEMASQGWLDNCTVVSNSTGYWYGGLFLADGASATNTIVYHNSATAHPDWSAGVGAGLAYCCVPTSAPDVCVECITDDPALADLDNGDYRLTAGSPCVNRGTNEPWMDGAADLDGRPRVDRFGQRVDLGAYEFLPAGTLMNVR